MKIMVMMTPHITASPMPVGIPTITPISELHKLINCQGL